MAPRRPFPVNSHLKLITLVFVVRFVFLESFSLKALIRPRKQRRSVQLFCYNGLGNQADFEFDLIK